jgi:peptidoglycan-associated lipoprotein
MKQTAWTHTALAALVLGMAGCSSTPVAQAPAPAPAPAAAPAPVAAPAPAPQGQARPVARVDAPSAPLDPLKDPNGALAKRSVYFDFDSFDIRAEFSPLLIAHGDYLSKTAGRNVVIEGNADERGSHEYNLALGQRRAQAVLERLRMLGVKDAQMEAVSYGEERPRVTGQGETAWAENRRADVVYR